MPGQRRSGRGRGALWSWAKRFDRERRVQPQSGIGPAIGEGANETRSGQSSLRLRDIASKAFDFSNMRLIKLFPRRTKG